MSPIGRIFIVLNLILSAAFLGWAANALEKTQAYKQQLADEKKAHEEAQAAKTKEVEDLVVKLNAATDTQRTFREQRDGFEAESNRSKTQLDELKRTNDQMQANLTKIQATLGDYKNSIDQLMQQKDDAVEARHQAEVARDNAQRDKDAAVLAQRDAEEATSSATRRIADLEAEAAGLREQVASLDARIAQIVAMTDIKLSDVVAPPPIDAYVLNVDRSLKLVVLNKGKKDNVREGYTFDVYRGSQYKGRVRIQDVQESMSSAIILNEKSAITSGDSATTTL
jgi:hypothetical protein